MELRTRDVQELVRQNDLTDLEKYQLYRWTWSVNYNPSPIIQELRTRVSRKIGVIS